MEAADAAVAFDQEERQQRHQRWKRSEEQRAEHSDTGRQRRFIAADADRLARSAAAE